AERDAVHSTTVVEDDLDLAAGLTGHVAGGQDDAVFRDDHPAAGRPAHLEADGAWDDLVDDLAGLLLQGPEVVERLGLSFADSSRGVWKHLHTRVGEGQPRGQHDSEQGKQAEAHGRRPLLAERDQKRQSIRYGVGGYGFQPASGRGVTRRPAGGRPCATGATVPLRAGW